MSFASISDNGAATAAAIVAAAVALATWVGYVARRSVDKSRNRLREQDAIQGFRDTKGDWHPGIVERVESLEDWRERHELHHSEAP